MLDATCPVCGVRFESKSPDRRRGRRRVNCSPACTARAADRRSADRKAAAKVQPPCRACGVEMKLAPSRRIRMYCSKFCSDVAAGNRRAVPLPERQCLLPECGAPFTPIYDRQGCCCEQHGKNYCNQRRRAAGLEPPLPWDDKRKAAWHKRRALLKGAEVGEPVILAMIAKRDGYRCGICGKRVDMSIAWPKPMHPSIDHIVPLSKGGAHEPANCQLAHGRCNAGKGNRGAEQQLALIG